MSRAAAQRRFADLGVAQRGKPLPVREMAHGDAVAAFGEAPAMPGWTPPRRQWW